MKLNKKQIKLIGSSVKTLNYEGNELCVLLDGHMCEELRHPNITHHGLLRGLVKSPCWISSLQVEDAYGKWHRLLYKYSFDKKKEWFCYPVRYQFLIDNSCFMQGYSITNPDKDFFLSISPVPLELVNSLLSSDWTKFVFVYPVIATKIINPQGIDKADVNPIALTEGTTKGSPRPFTSHEEDLAEHIGDKMAKVKERTGKLKLKLEDQGTYERTNKRNESDGELKNKEAHFSENREAEPIEEDDLPF